MTYTVSSPRNIPQSNLSGLSRKVGQPVPDSLRIRYGVITAVDNDTSQVKIKLYTNTGRPDIEPPGYHPLINPLSQVHLLWGKLRKGLAVRAFYRGKEDPASDYIVEVIGDEGLDFLKKEAKENILSTGPYKILSGGIFP